jgi:transcriptional regulator with XRE-family HTH domain
MQATFGDHLRLWRERRGMSQLALGTAADVSQRHISFVETGRSRPSRELVCHLGVVLDVPLRDRNAMLIAAGYAPMHSETDPSALPTLLPALQFVVDAHDPYMAVIVDRRWNVIASNDAAQRFAARVLDPGVIAAGGVLNLMRATFDPRGLRRFIINWESVWPTLVAGLERDVARAPGDAHLASLLEELSEMTGPAPRQASEREGRLLLPLEYRVGDHRFELFTTIATIDAPLDVTVAELRIETFWPADAESDAAWRAFVSES